MRDKVKTVILGASYFAIGYAAAHPDCLILDSTQIPGGDFHTAAKTADLSALEGHAASLELAALMKEYQVWKGNRFDVLKAAPVICEYVSRHPEIRILLDAKIISVQKNTDGCHVEYATNDGVSGIDCQQLLDTTTLRDTFPEGARCTFKTLNLFSISLTDDFDCKIKAVIPDCRIAEGMNPGEKTVKIPFAPEENILRAYRRAVDLWKLAFPNGEEKILFIAQDFDYTCEEVESASAPCPWINSNFPDPLTAFAAGMSFQL